MQKREISQLGEIGDLLREMMAALPFGIEAIAPPRRAPDAVEGIELAARDERRDRHPLVERLALGQKVLAIAQAATTTCAAAHRCVATAIPIMVRPPFLPRGNKRLAGMMVSALAEVYVDDRQEEPHGDDEQRYGENGTQHKSDTFTEANGCRG